MIKITDTVSIDDSEFSEEFKRAGGPGGQHVNKVSSAVVLRFDIRAAASIPEDAKERLARLGGRRVTDDGVLVIEARRFRSQDANREDARTRLAALVLRSLERPRPRAKTRPTRASKERRLESKRKRTAAKKMRRPPRGED